MHDSAAPWCRVASPALSGSVAAHAQAILLADCLEDALTERAYQADLVGLHSHVSYEDPTGLELSVFGFSERLVSLAHMMFQVWPAQLCSSRMRCCCGCSAAAWPSRLLSAG